MGEKSPKNREAKKPKAEKLNPITGIVSKKPVKKPKKIY